MAGVFRFVQHILAFCPRHYGGLVCPIAMELDCGKSYRQCKMGAEL